MNINRRGPVFETQCILAVAVCLHDNRNVNAMKQKIYNLTQ